MAGNALRLVISISASADSARSVAQRLRFRRSRRGQRASYRSLSLKLWTFSPIKGRSHWGRDRRSYGHRAHYCEKFERASLKFIGARSSNGVDDPAGSASIVRRVVGGTHREFLKRVHAQGHAKHASRRTV